MSELWGHVRFGAKGPMISRLGLGSSYGLGGRDVERAFERGVNFMFWGLRRRGDFGSGIRRIAHARRERVVIAVQSYTRAASLMAPSLDCALRTLGTDYVDLLCLGWWDDVPPERILDAARKLQARGKARHLVISGHHRPAFEAFASLPDVDGVMVRYNAAHPGAEVDVFPHLPACRPGVIAFTATRWGSLLKPSLVPAGEPVPRASDCYRFVLSHPSVHSSLAGPRDAAELDEAMAALDRGPLSAEEAAWMRRVGAGVRSAAGSHRVIGWLDRARTALTGAGAERPSADVRRAAPATAPERAAPDRQPERGTTARTE